MTVASQLAHRRSAAGAEWDLTGALVCVGAGAPIRNFILTRRDPAEMPQWPLVTYVDDITKTLRRGAGHERT